MFKKWFKKKNEEPKKSSEIDNALMDQLAQFRENTKSLDYLRKELEEVNKGKTDIEIVESLAKTLQNDKQKKA